MILYNVKNYQPKNPKYLKSKYFDHFSYLYINIFSLAARKLGTLLTKVAANKHFQRFAALKPVAGVIEKLSNSEIGANIELMNISGLMTVNIFSINFLNLVYF